MSLGTTARLPVAAQSGKLEGVIVEIINTGSELMLGRVLNTHQQWLCRRLSDLGYLVERQVAVADTAEAIQRAVREALGRAKLVLCTGGLGPTSDDLTREVLAEMLGRPLREDAGIKAGIEKWFASRSRPLPPKTLVQAQVPEGAVVLPNANGTAPGLIMEAGTAKAPAWLVMLPGPPRELRPMFSEQVIPWLLRTFPLPVPFACRTLRATGIGESVVQERIAEPLTELSAQGLEIGYCARPSEVDIRLSARRPGAAELVVAAVGIVRQRMAPFLFAEEDQSLESAVVKLLATAQRTLVVAESCTGGRLASRITDVPGASGVFRGGVVSYHNELKEDLLSVRTETLERHGAVSEETARQMAEGARTRLRADYALATTGIAGPTGGTPDKPVGTVFIALATAQGTQVTRQLNRLDRESFKQMTAQQALEMLRRELVGGKLL